MNTWFAPIAGITDFIGVWQIVAIIALIAIIIFYKQYKSKNL